MKSLSFVTPEQRIIAVIAALATTWTLLPSLAHLALPVDILESGMWGREWIVGSYKHPALPSWCLELARLAAGGTLGWSAYLTSATFTATSLWLTFVVVRDLIGAQAAAAAALSLVGVEYFLWRSAEFNHDIAQIPFWIATPLCAWRATRGSSVLWWLALGVVGAGGLYAKLSHGVILLITGAWLLYDRQARAQFATLGPWVAAIVFAILVVPLLRWLLASDFSAITFARGRGLFYGSSSRSAKELLNVILVLAPAIVVLALSGMFGPGSRKSRTGGNPNKTDDHSARLFLAIIAIAPPVTAVLLAHLAGSGVRHDWFAPMVCLVPALLIDRYASPIDERALRRVGIIVAPLLFLIPVIYAVVLFFPGDPDSRKFMRVNWPQATIASRFSALWSAATPCPLKIIAGHNWIAGLVGINHPDNPSILFYGNLKLSPWITRARLKREGMLVVWDGHIPTPEMLALVGERPVQSEWFSFQRAKKGAGQQIPYVIIPPEQVTAMCEQPNPITRR